MAGVKFDQDKPRLSLVFTDAFLEVAKVGTKGAKKYGDHNYKDGMKWSRLMDAGLRHALKANKGIMYDIEPDCEACQNKTCEDHTGELHMAQAAWNFLALTEYIVNNLGENDLFKGYENEKK